MYVCIVIKPQVTFNITNSVPLLCPKPQIKNLLKFFPPLIVTFKNLCFDFDYDMVAKRLRNFLIHVFIHKINIQI